MRSELEYSHNDEEIRFLDVSFFDSIDQLLDPLPSRSDLKRIPKLPTVRNLHIKVERTLPFEWISSILPPFFRVWGSEVAVDYSEYDTTLSNIGHENSADMYFIWLDWRLYRESMTAERAIQWLKGRLGVLRDATSNPIWINNWPERRELGEDLFSPDAGNRGWFRELNALLSTLVNTTVGCGLLDLAGLAVGMGDSFFDDRNDELSHYPFSDQASIVIAQHIGLHLAPAVCLPRLKAIALDLDETLYSGVLGEDGIEGVLCTEGHRELQKVLLRLKQSGILLTLCSRNELKDVEELFLQRSDFPLRWEDFTAFKVNWLPKSDNLRTLALRLNIDPSSFLFIDDNPAELLKVAGSLPEVRLLQANKDAWITAVRLCRVPGLYLLRLDDSASVRSKDIKANEVRENLKSHAGDYVSYLSSLQMIVRIYVNHQAHAKRIYELSHKTNQFNLALARLKEMEIEKASSQPEYMTVTVQLSDYLVDSGIIGAFICKLDSDGETARLYEVLFSCRALGREIETVAFAQLLELLSSRGVKNLYITVKEGPRNTPAREWLSRFVGKPGEHPSVESEPLSKLLAQVKTSSLDHPAKVEVVI